MRAGMNSCECLSSIVSLKTAERIDVEFIHDSAANVEMV